MYSSSTLTPAGSLAASNAMLFFGLPTPPNNSIQKLTCGQIPPMITISNHLKHLADSPCIAQVDEATRPRKRRSTAQLKDALLDGGPISKQRRPCKKRIHQSCLHLSVR